ncbi:hypothetical protein [Speluncibacter jeojiensis]|uniref:hypothetical protein n=1 Tax=Speluncibacter jeojiensis TaxID=2710754 RepID=UPI002410AFF6|nr:hypothetical protein [Rhodococcus sp. D2-41]
MSTWPGHWPIVAREIAEQTDLGVAALRAGDAVALADSVTELAAQATERVGLLHSSTVRALLEQAHPDGLSGNDVQDVLTSMSGVPVPVPLPAVAEVLTGALGVGEPAESTPAECITAALAIIAVLAPPGTLAVHLRRAMAEIERDQTVEMP